MSDTTASLRQKIDSAGDLKSVVGTMKAVAASSIGQYQKSVLALADYYRAVELGLGLCFRESASDGSLIERKDQTDHGPIGAVVFGSDRDWWDSLTTSWRIMRSRRSPACPANRKSGPSASAFMSA